MKHVFYVEKYKKIINRDYFADLHKKIKNKEPYQYRSIFSYSAEDGIGSVEGFKDNPVEFIWAKAEEMFDTEFIASTIESKESRLISVGDKIKLFSKKGVVIDIYYDPVENAVHYKTDIKIYVNEEISEQEMESIIQLYHEQADTLEKFCEERIAERKLREEAEQYNYIHQTKKKKSFWEKLFR